MSVEAVGYKTTIDVKSAADKPPDYGGVNFTKALDDVIHEHDTHARQSGPNSVAQNDNKTHATENNGLERPVTSFDNAAFLSDDNSNRDSGFYRSNQSLVSDNLKPSEFEQKSQDVDPGSSTEIPIDTPVKSHDTDDEDEDEEDDEPASGMVYTFQQSVYRTCSEHSNSVNKCVLVAVFVGYFIYFGFALDYQFGDEGSWRLVIVTAIVIFFLMLNALAKCFATPLDRVKRNISALGEQTRCLHIQNGVRWALYIGMTAFMVTYLIVEVFIDNPENMASLGGIAAFLLLLYVTSSNPAKVNWHPIFWGLAMQFVFALLILRTEWGNAAFQYLGDRVTEFLAHTSAGAAFVLGTDQLEKNGINIFAFSILPIVIFVGSITAVMFYLGAIQVVVKYVGRFLSFCLGTSAAESLNASANIFLGMTESPLIIKNYIADMTKSEIHAVMTGGFATIAGSVLGAYINMGVPAKHLLSASVMSAPAALAMSKLACPETNPKKVARNQNFSKIAPSTDRNMIEAAATGAMFTIKLIANIAVNLIAFIAVLAFVNATLTWFGDRVGIDGFTFEFIASYLLYPVAVFMGADTSDCKKLAELVGVKTFTNEFVAYKRLGIIIRNNEVFANYTLEYNNSADWNWVGSDIYLNQTDQTLEYGVLFKEKSVLIATYALCGFANFGSIGITLGGMTALAPKRKALLSRIVIRAMIAGNVACFLTACIAGMLYEG